MKKRNNRFLAGTLAGLMMLTMLPVTALAAQEGADGDAASDTSNNIVNVVSDDENGQQAVNNDVNVEANGGNDNVQESADDSSDDTENVQESADDSNGGSDDTAAANQQEGENSGSDSSGESAPTPPPAAESFVAKIGTQTYETLEEAISVAKNGDTIEVGQDITIEEGGLAFVEKGALTIKGVGKSKPKITMKDRGIWLNETNVTFQNIEVVEENVITNAEADGSGNTANLVNNSDFILKNASLTLNGPGNKTGGSGMYLYKKSNLYVDDGSSVIISGFNADKQSGIFADESNYENMPNRDISVTGGSSITITDCDWHGMTVNPINILIDDNSKIDISKCGNKNYGGGLGCYYGKVTVSNSSALITDNNIGSGWGVFAKGLTVDSTSSFSACHNVGWGAALGEASNIASGAIVTLDNNDRAGLCVYTNSTGYWKGNVTIEEGAKFSASGNENGIEILPNGVLNMQDGTVTHNHSGTYGGGLYNRGGTAKIGGKAVIYNNHADTAGDDIYSETEPSVSLSQVNNGWMLDDCKEKYQKEHPIVGWYRDGKEKRWNGDGEGDAYYAEEYTVGKEAVSEALALKAAHGQLCNVTYEVTGDVPSDAGARPADAKVKKGGNYTVAPVQTTSQSRYTFSGWRINGVGDVVTEIKDIQQDVKLIGVWTRRSSGGGGGSSRPTVDIPDDVPTGLNGDDHFAYIVGYPNGNVEPNGNITRAEVATIFFRLLTEEVRTANSTQSNSLSDVTRGQWFNHAVSTLSSMGIVKGHNDGTFAPNAPITRAEFAAIAARFDDKNTDTSSKFTDIASHWAKNEIGIAANKGWINGYPDGTFRPNQYITRAEAMTLVNRVLNRLPENSSDLLDSMIKWPDNSDASAWYYLAVQEATNSHAYSDKSKDDKYEKWTTIRDARDWTELEK
ncbi:S-layer homology domain-containing protein [Agathobaculum sp.]|uniref:S-layer homology domain-containing protein n=1 Tax=Agathobaculum sp. TaxID=2048138 RepID=UPI003A8C608D